MLKTRKQTTVLSAIVLIILLCLTACTIRKFSNEINEDVTNDTPKVQNEQESDAIILFGEEYIKVEDIKYPKYVLKNIPTGLAKKQEYKLVMPTQEELDEIAVRLDPILSMCFSDYNCQKDNIYEVLFSYDHLDYVYPEYDDQVAEYIAKPLAINVENNFLSWDVIGIYEVDPLKKFPISEVLHDDEGNIDFDIMDELAVAMDGNTYIIGHNVFSGAYIDWLAEGVWNGKTDHESFFELKDGTLLYYHNGNYYTPELLGGRGGGIMNTSYIQNVTQLDGNKYEIEYYITDDVEPDYFCKAVIGLKENTDGFRFWSIFSIDFDV